MRYAIAAIAIGLLPLVAWQSKSSAKGPCKGCTEQAFAAYITGYSSADNDPPNSTAIWLDGKSGNAGGTGTFDDPITVAVADGRYPYGTIFYVPYLKRYFGAADSCPPCKEGHLGLPWLDVYVGDASGPDIVKCQERLTGIHGLIQNPRPTYVVERSAIFDGSCKI